MSRMSVVAVGLVAAFALPGCDEQNRFVPPPPPQVVVAHPVSREVTAYLNETGSLAAVNTVDLVTRVPGFVEAIGYQDGMILAVRFADAEEAVMRRPGGDPVSALAWDDKGQRLAFGTEDGAGGIVVIG